MKRITLEELEKQEKAENYRNLYEIIISLIENKKIKPIQASGLNGKKTALYKEYRIIEEKEDFSVYEEELLYAFVTMITFMC